jgi:hypothetical protein
MNTIQITTVDGPVNYTESEVVRFIEKAKGADELNESITKQVHTLRDMRNKVRDFFSESEWCDGETTITKEDVNALLDSIGASRLTTKYRASFTITGTFSVDVDDEDDVETIFADNVSVDFYSGDMDVDNIEVMDVEADE